MRRVGALLAAFIGLYAAAVAWEAGRRLDASARSIDPDPTAVGEALIRTVDSLGWATMLAATVCLLAFARRQGRDRLAAVAATVICANLSAQALKAGLGWADPLGGETRRINGPRFFPSGHATAAMSLALGLVLAAARPQRGLAVVIGATFAATVGAGIVVLHAHTSSDVLGGYLVAAIWGAAAAARLRRSTPALTAPDPAQTGGPGSRSGPLPWGAAAIVGVALVAVGADRSLDNGALLATVTLVQGALALLITVLVARS